MYKVCVCGGGPYEHIKNMSWELFQCIRQMQMQCEVICVVYKAQNMCQYNLSMHIR